MDSGDWILGAKHPLLPAQDFTQQINTYIPSQRGSCHEDLNRIICCVVLMGFISSSRVYYHSITLDEIRAVIDWADTGFTDKEGIKENRK